MADIYPNARRIPLPFAAAISARVPSSRLPAAFARPLRHIADGGALVPDVPHPKPPEPYRPPQGRMAVSAGWGFVLREPVRRARSSAGGFAGLGVGSDMSAVSLDVMDATACFQTTVGAMMPLQGRLKTLFAAADAAGNCAAGRVSAAVALDGFACPKTSGSLHLAGCGGDSASSGLGALLATSADSAFSDDVLMTGCTSGGTDAAADLARCFSPETVPAVPVPCEYYEIPLEPEPVPDTYVCGLRPPSNRLALRFSRRKVRHAADRVPLPFACFYVSQTPVLPSYIMLNTISASFDGGKPLDLLSASFSCDMSGYCWQGSLTLPPEEFMKLGMDARAKGDAAEITVNINALSFRILAEDYSDNRRFGQKSYTVTGRSPTARLGQDYALPGKSVFSQPVYARQIADEVLKFSGIAVDEWSAADWLVPGGVYAATDKAPIAVLQELAAAAGAFVESDRSLNALRIKPKWKLAAWQVADAAAEVEIPSSAVFGISGQKTAQARANGVFVSADHAKGAAADVHRQGTDREPRASALSGALYTDQAVLAAAGMAALSATGVHKRETVSLPVSEKYGIPLAQLGQIWRINEPSGSWQGVVAGVSLEVSWSDGAPSVSQSVVIDRYLDE